MTLHIYYRHAPVARLGLKARPAQFSYEGCLRNLFATLQVPLADGRVTFTLLFDGTEVEFAGDPLREPFAELHARRGTAAVPPRLEYVAGGDQRRAWRACMGVVSADVDAGRVGATDHVYLLENDYLHRPEWFRKFEELLASRVRWDYLTFYDHPDKYPDLNDLHDARRYVGLASRLYCSGTQHWRTTPSTCATYVLSSRTFLRDRWLLRLGIYDFKLFTLLVRFGGRVLLSPVPSLATHGMSEFLAPTVQWEWR